MFRTKHLAFWLIALPLVFAAPALRAESPAAASAISAPAFSESPPQLLGRFAAVQTTEKAAYQVLSEEDSIGYDAKGGYSITTHEVVRVLTTEGVNQWSVLDADWQPWRDFRPRIRARVVRAPGLESVLAQENVVESSAQDGDYNLRSDSRRLSAPLPNLEPGALIEFELVESGKEARDGAGYARRIYLARRGPVESRVVRFEYPQGLPFTYTTEGNPTVAVQKTIADGKVTLVLRFDRIAGHSKLEQLLPYDVAPVPVLAFGTAASWKAVAKTYFDATEPLLDPKPVRAYALAALGGLDPAAAPAKAARLVADKLRHDVRYTGIYFGENAIIPHAPADTLSSGYGDCKDQASLLAACLRSIGIDARLALLMAGTGYDVDPAVPGLELFNHAIVYLPALGMWIDPTDIYSPAGSIPYEDQGRGALVIGPDSSGLTVTPKAKAADNWYRIERSVSLSESGKATQIVERVTMGGSFDEGYRARFNSAPRKDKLDELAKAGKADFDAEQVDSAFSDPLDLSTPFETVVTAHNSSKGWTGDDTADFVVRGGDAFIQLPRELELEAPDHDPRVADVFLPESMTTTVEYKINAPPGFRLGAVPDHYSLDLGPAKLDVNFVSSDPRDLVADFTLTTLKDRFAPAELDKLRTESKKFFDSTAAVASFVSVGQELLNTGRYQDALGEFRSLQALHPTEALHHIQASSALVSAGFPQDALVEAESAVKLEPDSSRAHKNLAFVCLYGPLGRQFGPGSDVARARDEYDKAFKLDSTDYQSLFNIGIIDEFGTDGRFRGAGARLSDAVSTFEKASDQIERYDMAERYLGDLFFLARYDDALKASAAFKDRSNGAHFLFGATAMKSGTQAAVALAGGLILDVDKRRAALKQAGLDLLSARQYAAAADLFVASARGTSDYASTADYARRIRDVKRYDPKALAQGTSAPLLLLLDDVLKGRTPRVDVFVPSARKMVETELGRSAIDAQLSGIQANLDRLGLTRDSLMDLLASKLSMTTASRGRAVLAVASLPDFGSDHLLDLMLERSGDAYLLVDINETIGVGAQMLSLIAAGDLQGARDWLDALRDPRALLGSFASALPADLLALVPGDDSSADSLSLAAAVLSWGTSDQEQARACMKLVADAAKRSDDAQKKLGYLNLALGFAATAKDPSTVELAREQAQNGAARAQDAVIRIRALGGAGLGAEAATAAEEARAKYPGDAGVMRSLRFALAVAGRHEEALAAGQALLSMGGAQPSDYNNTAWEMLFQKNPDFGIIDKWGLTQRLSGADYSLHTLCCLYAAAGRYEEARAAFTKYLEMQDVEKIDSALWLAHGLLARSFGLPERAEASFAQAEALGDPKDATDSATAAALWASRP